VKSIPTGRLYYSISEVSDMVGVKPHVLRYWETQFKMLRPKKGVAARACTGRGRWKPFSR